VPDVIESAANAAATGVQVAIESHLPKNISLGTQDLCIGFTKNVTCKPLPLNLTELLPSVVDNLPDTFQSIVQDKVDSLQPFATALTNVVYIRILLIVGLISMLLFTIIFIATILSRLLRIVGRLIRLGHLSRILVYIALWIICCLPILIATLVLIVFQQKARLLPSWVEVQHGEVGRLCLAAFCCGIVMSFISAVSPTLIH
jgi:hypothetical protein